MIPFLKNDLGAMFGVPYSKNFQYSASHCFVPILNSNLEICWYQMDLLRFPVTLLDGSFGILAGSLGVIFKISCSKSWTLSTKAISTAFSIIFWSILNSAIIPSHHIKQANDHQPHQIKVWTTPAWPHRWHLCYLWFYLKHLWLAQNPIWSCE